MLPEPRPDSSTSTYNTPPQASRESHQAEVGAKRGVRRRPSAATGFGRSGAGPRQTDRSDLDMAAVGITPRPLVVQAALRRSD